MPNLGTTEIIIIALVIVVLFGSKKLPDAARSIGRSLRIFKAETKGLRDDDKSADAMPSAPVPSAGHPAPAPAPLAVEPSPTPQVQPLTPPASQPAVNGTQPVDAERR